MPLVETSGAVTRTTTTTHLLDGRTDTVAQAVTGLASSTPRDKRYSTYDTVTGALLNAETRTAASVVTGRTSSTYDAWGRTVTTKNEVPGDPANPGAGLVADTATTVYDAAGRVASVTDAKGVTTYTYDGTDAAGKLERRGQVTKLEVTRAGTTVSAANLLTYTGAYDSGGKLYLENLPGGLVKKVTFDEVGQQRSLEYQGQLTKYTESVDPTTQETVYTPGTPYTGTWLAWSNQVNGKGQITREWTPTGAAFGSSSSGVMNTGDIQPAPIGQAEASDKLYGYDQAGRLTLSVDRTARTTGSTINPDVWFNGGYPCTIRRYSFDANGNRIALDTERHADGDCYGTPDSTTTNASYSYDSADRPYMSLDPDGSSGPQSPNAWYIYDELGRQTTLPAADAPDPTKGHISLGYYDNDLPRTITQGGATTTYTLDSADRRWRSVTVAANGDKTTTDRHYTDGGDNPTWTTSTTIPNGGSAQPEVFTRFTETLGGDYGVQTDAAGTATMSLANPHGDTVTNVTIPAGTAATTPAVSIGGWADYTEYGLPNTGADGIEGTTTADVNQIDGALGYGWLGAKQRSTTTESAGLTLMGVRLYNNRRGLFTAVDPVPGGNSTAYTYPQDPINGYDLNGKWWGSNLWNKATSAVSSGWHRVTSSRTWNSVASWGRSHAGLLNGAGNFFKVVSYVAGYCPLAQCAAVSIGAGLISAGSYAWAGIAKLQTKP